MIISEQTLMWRFIAMKRTRVQSGKESFGRVGSFITRLPRVKKKGLKLEMMAEGKRWNSTYGAIWGGVK